MNGPPGTQPRPTGQSGHTAASTGGLDGFDGDLAGKSWRSSADLGASADTRQAAEIHPSTRPCSGAAGVFLGRSEKLTSSRARPTSFVKYLKYEAIGSPSPVGVSSRRILPSAEGRLCYVWAPGDC